MSEEKTALERSYDALLATTSLEAIEVATSTGPVDLYPVTAAEAIVLSRDFPSLQNLLLGGAGNLSDEEKGKVLIKGLLDSGPEAIATFIIYSARLKRKPNRKALIEAILDKSDDDIIALLEGARRVSAPKGFSDFLDRIRGYARAMGMNPTMLQPAPVEDLAA